MTGCSDLASFRDVLDLWRTREACAAELGSEATASLVSKWWQRDSVPSDWWAILLATSTANSAGVTADLLTRLAARPARSFEPTAAEARA